MTRVRQNFPQSLKPKQLDLLGELYRPYRTVAAGYCWRAAQLYGASAASAVTA